MTRAITRIFVALSAGIALSATLVGCSGLTQTAEVKQGLLAAGFTDGSADTGEVTSLSELTFAACTDIYRSVLNETIPGGTPVTDVIGAGFPARFPATASCGATGMSGSAHITYMYYAGAQQVIYDGLVAILTDDGWVQQPSGATPSAGVTLMTLWSNSAGDKQIILQYFQDDSTLDLDYVAAAMANA
jgi:hypothetical protein